MNRNKLTAARSERGMALISSLLLLIIITILALTMFRGFGTQEKIASNLREKDRALHAAVSAQQYAEWWLTSPSSTVAAGAVTCAGVLNANLNNQGQICNQTLPLALGFPAGTLITGMPIPWTLGGQYTPSTMSVGAAGANNDPGYAAPPGFYITDRGVAGDAAGEAYQIDAYGYATTATNLATT
ncbi:MAG TPA: PilX N-terminal domain-containing pilus assembly protein, partial [Candidatus Dormibacteraeota bacterium]|nr:PilX N-terminal domain-containing pilus assembly protein [Candidatus Dormibacteraeota bacterium]